MIAATVTIAFHVMHIVQLLTLLTMFTMQNKQDCKNPHIFVVTGTSVPFDMETDCWKNGSVNCSIDDLWIENNSTTVTSSMSFYQEATTTISDHVLATLYWIIFVVGVACNLLVVAVVIWKFVKSPQSDAMTIFVGSLAVCDLGLLLWTTWINALLSVNPEWMFGKLSCQMYTVWRSLTANCSIATQMFISVDRYELYHVLKPNYCCI